MTKILIFCGVPIDDAAEVYRIGLVTKRLIKEGYSVVFTSVAGNFVGEETRSVNGLKVRFIGQAHYFARKPFSDREKIDLGRVLWENGKICFRFAKILRGENPDRVLVVTAMPVSLLAGLIARLMGFRTLIDIDDLVVGQMEASGYPKLLTNIYGLIERSWIKFVFNKISVCSHFLQERYPGAHLIPNMIQTEFWKPRSNAVGRKERRIVFVGQIGSYHGQDEFLEAIAPVLGKHKDWRLVFVGGGEREEKLKIKNEKLKMERQIFFTGQVDQNGVRKILSESDVGILPLWDTPVHRARHPLKLLEYLAAGLAVVASDVGEAGQIIKDGENGILCPAGDIECLAQKAETVLEDQTLAKKISANAAASVQDFSAAKIFPRWLEFLEL